MKKKKFEFYIEFHGDSTKKEKKKFWIIYIETWWIGNFGKLWFGDLVNCSPTNFQVLFDAKDTDESQLSSYPTYKKGHFRAKNALITC